MHDDFMFLPVSMQKQQIITEVRSCNEFTSKYGLQLTREDITLVMESRKEALANSARIEFGGGVIRKIIMEFADSPYIYQDNYVSTLMELQECFYETKNESMEELTDDELIHLMKFHFDHDCQGSVEYLQSTVLDKICHDLRYGSKSEKGYGYDDDYSGFFQDKDE